jgi:tripartite-type tricarboxylate transporter receptor subunit TctC
MLSVAAVQLRLTVLLLVTLAARPVGAVGGVTSLPGGGGSFSSGAVHGAAGPGSTPAPISKMVPSTKAAGTAPFHRMRDSAPRARVTSAACRPV